MHDETRRRVAMLRHAGGFLRAIAGDSPRIAAMVAREIGMMMQRHALDEESAAEGALPFVRGTVATYRAGPVTVVSGGDA